jgi:hypothetical protein
MCLLLSQKGGETLKGEIGQLPKNKADKSITKK